MDTAEEVKRRLSMDNVARHYGYAPNQSGFIRCPFHQGDRTPSLKIYSELGRGFHCHACGAGSSVIDFVMLLFHIPFSAAIIRLDTDFGLGLTSERPDAREVEKLRKQRREASRARQAYESDYTARTLEFRRLWEAKKNKAPTVPDAPADPEYIEACKRLDELDQWFLEHPYER